MQRVLPQPGGPLAVTTLTMCDVPMSFGSGCIGRAAVNIVANRLLAMGATPRYVSVGAVVDCDINAQLLEVVDRSMADAAVQAEMEFASGQSVQGLSEPHTGIDLTLTAMGVMPPDMEMGMEHIDRGDVIIALAEVGTYGTAVAASRRNMLTVIEGADGNALCDGVHALMRDVTPVKCLIFPEHGVNEALHAIAAEHPSLQTDYHAIPVNEAVRAAADILGVDADDMPCAGTMLAVVRGSDAARALKALHSAPYCGSAAVIAHL